MTDGLIKWFKAAGIRALYTFLEVSLGFLTVGACISDINWTMMLSTSCVAALYSIVKSVLIGLPEVPNDFKNMDGNDEKKT